LDATPERPGPARTAPAHPAGWSWRAGRPVIFGTLSESITDKITLAAAGCAYYATLALFPAITMLISVYGLVFDVQSVQQQAELLQDVLPPPAFALIEQRVQALVSQPSGTLSVGLIVSSLLTFWSSATGTKSILSALNVAYDAAEARGILMFQLVAFAMTLCAILAAVLAIAVLVFLPAVIAFVGLSAHQAGLINALGMALVIALVGLSIAFLYRFGPSRRRPSNQHIFPGAVLATVLWLIASELLSFYVTNIASFGVTYGPIGAVVGIMLWFWVSAYAVLLGAELNAQLEQRRTP